MGIFTVMAVVILLAIFLAVALFFIIYRALKIEESPLSQSVDADDVDAILEAADNVMDSAMKNLDSTMKNLDKQTDNLANNLDDKMKNFDKWLEKNTDMIIIKDFSYYSTPSKYNKYVVNKDYKVEIPNQKIPVPDQKIETPKQPEIPPVRKEVKKIDLRRKVDLDVE